MRHVALIGCLFLVGAGCTTRTPALTALHYQAHVRGLEPCIVDVDVEVEGDAAAFGGAEPAGLVSVEVADGRGKRRPEVRGGAAEVDCRGACRISYRYDLHLAAKAAGWSMRAAHERSGEVLAAATTWLLRPEVPVAGASVDLTVEVPDGLFFTTGLRKSADGRSYTLRSEELPTLGFTAFGRTAPRLVKATGGVVEVLVFPGKRAASDEAIDRWVAQSARAMDQVFGRFPMGHAAVFVVPSPDSNEVDYGVTLPSGGASIAVLFGEETEERTLIEEDWVLTHEMFHLGVPSFSREEAWLNEGLATYYEPLARTRAGLRTPMWFWQKMARDLPRGVQSDDAIGGARDYDRIYWGGALLAMRADVEIRRRTGRKRSLDDGLRRVLALGGDATKGWTLARYVGVIDEAVGVPVLGELVARAKEAGPRPGCGGQRIDWPPGSCATDAEVQSVLFDALGVRGVGETLAFAEDAPLGAIRRDLVAPLDSGFGVARNADLEFEAIPFAGAGDGRGVRVVKVGVMNQPHSIADLLR